MNEQLQIDLLKETVQGQSAVLHALITHLRHRDSLDSGAMADDLNGFLSRLPSERRDGQMGMMISIYIDLLLKTPTDTPQTSPPNYPDWFRGVAGPSSNPESESDVPTPEPTEED